MAIPQYTVVVEQAEDGWWVAEVVDLPGCVAHGKTEDEATDRAIALAACVLRDLTAN